MTPELDLPNPLSPEAIQRLVDSHRQFLSFLEKRVESRAVAEDILQSAFVRGLERGGELRDEESAVAWFYRVLRNAVIDHYRTKRTLISLEDVNQAEVRQEDGIEEKLDLQVKSQQLRAALQVLTEQQQRVLILKFIDGLSTREIARRLGKQQGAVRGLQMRALQKLARCPGLQREQFYGQ